VDVAAYDHIMYSFHSLPLRQIKKTCAKCGDNPVDESSPHLHGPLCYRGQCLRTARLLHDRLIETNPAAANLTKSLTYQSRLGRTPWLAPQSEDRVAELALSGVKRLIVVAPGFTVDCLETLEELDYALKTTFLKNGGESFHRVKCLNNNPVWVTNVHDHLSKLLNADYECEKEEYLHVEAQRTP